MVFEGFGGGGVQGKETKGSGGGRARAAQAAKGVGYLNGLSTPRKCPGFYARLTAPWIPEARSPVWAKRQWDFRGIRRVVFT